MGKNRKSKRQLIRDEKRAKKRKRELADDEERAAKRQHHDRDETLLDSGGLNNDYDPTADFIPFDDDEPSASAANGNRGPRGGNFEREFFGMLADQEQEYFRHADELLELNDFPSPEDRHLFLQNVYREARGKELKLASSQSCSRLMERLILLSSAKQKKRLFGAFAGHFMTLVTHRFASHCCEKLFLMSAPVVTQELSGGGDENAETGEADGAEDSEEVTEAMNTSMEDLFLLTLDELEEHLSFLLSDRYGSHALRVLLVVLSGRPLDQAGTKSLLQGKNKEYVTVEGASAASSGLNSQTRAVPSSFTSAIEKIIADSTANMDATALRVLAKHPTGNPTLQLLLDLELSLLAKKKKGNASKEDNANKDDQGHSSEVTLLERLVPDAPASFADEKSQACEFVNSMLYDPIGSRLLETLIAHCPGKIFKGLQANIFGPRIQSLLRNDIASYPAIKVLNRLSKENLADAVQKTLPELPSLLERGRLNVIKTFFERCSVRGATAELNSLLQALTTACGGNWKYLVPKLCPLDEAEPAGRPDEKKFQQPDAKNKAALLSHGSQVASALLTIPGQPSKAIQNSLLSLSTEQLLRLATSSAPTATVLLNALAAPPQIPHFHKLLVAAMLPNIYDIAASQHGSAVVNAIISAPSRGEGVAVVPFHLKENIMAQLERRERDLRSTWLGRNVWRTWRGDLWTHRRHDWVRWAKETDPEGQRVAAMPAVKEEKKVSGKKKGNGKPAAAGLEEKKGRGGENNKSYDVSGFGHELFTAAAQTRQFLGPGTSGGEKEVGGGNGSGKGKGMGNGVAKDRAKVKAEAEAEAEAEIKGGGKRCV
ncbi:532b38d7-2ec4-4568-95ac-edf1b3e5f7ce [Thermothielavioides terrestris]|uniref:Nucleolar protein 9 n=1 Tax=Thermothielavioides terrestris TaxID=2587410 RepID=A0A446BQA7_9PEZI|nr:532b38d7-2ec4-4568-95ac-edf1b3e5f7ce [Thermothielavioides terrestris]